MNNISDLVEHLAQYAEYAFAYKDREELERVLKEYFENLNNNRWIPASERLPEKSDIYLATFLEEGKRYVERFYYSDFMGWMMPVAWQDEGRIENIIAWQPLPEPWKESVEE